MEGLKAKNFLNKKGQAAVTDALFMLLIISGLCVMLFAFSSAYGQNISAHILRQYSVEYATDALKSILYSSTPRDPEISFEQAEEVDYLMAVVKEDYANFVGEKFELGIETKKLLKNNIEKVMRPLSDQFDYLFIIVTPDREYVYVLLYKSEFLCQKRVNGVLTDLYSCVEGEREIYVVSADPAHKFYLCDNVNPGNLADFLFTVGESAQASSPLLLPHIPSIEKAQASLIIWPATLIYDKYLFTDADPNALGCIELIS